MDINRFIDLHPNLYHMAEADSWESIQEHGLLSISAILDLHGITGTEREQYETHHRAEMMSVCSQQAPKMVIRDQKPMFPARISQGLMNGILPEQWYYFINQKVFFWAKRERLFRLLNARYYRDIEHDVLTINTRSFVLDNLDSIKICHMNSGNALPVAHGRDYSIFKHINEYPTKPNGNPTKEVVEVTADYSVRNIRDYVIKVERIIGNDILRVIE